METKVYKLPLSPNYVSDWGALEGIRELVANNVDYEGELNCKWSDEGGFPDITYSLELTTTGVQLPPSLLLLGNSTKSKTGGTIGNKGEGLKLSFLTLLREGLGIKCENGNKLWEPYFDNCEQYGSSMLHIKETELVEGNDLVLTITGISDGLRQEVIDNTLAMQSDLDVTETSYGRILKDARHARKVFVGGLFVCNSSDITMGYDFKPECMPLNRDRKQIDTWDMKKEVGKMHMEKTPAKEVAEMLMSNKRDLNYLQYHKEVVPEEVVEEVFNLHIKINGDVPLSSTMTEHKQMKKEGYSDVVHLGNDNLTNIIKLSPNYNPEPSEEVLTPHQLLLEYYNNFEEGMTNLAIEEFDKIMIMSKDWEV